MLFNLRSVRFQGLLGDSPGEIDRPGVRVEEKEVQMNVGR